jgi:hypothetical protein
MMGGGMGMMQGGMGMVLEAAQLPIIKPDDSLSGPKPHDGRYGHAGRHGHGATSLFIV